MSDYRMAVGSNLPETAQAPIVPQPASTGIQATRRTYSGSGTVIEEGLYIELKYNVMSVAQYYSFLSTYGLLGAGFLSTVSIYVPNYAFVYTAWTGLLVKPEIGVDVRRENFFLRNVIFLVRDLAHYYTP